MYGHRDAKIAYLAHPRTASTATCAALRRQAGFVSLHTHHETPIEAAKKRPEIHNKLDFSDDWLIVSTIRNHFDLLRSEFVNTNYHPQDEPLLTSEVCDRLIDTSIYWRRNLPAPFAQLFYHVPFCTDLLRYENLLADVNNLLARRDLDPITIPKINVTTQTQATYHDLFTEDGREWVENEYAIEMARYGYTWEDA